MIEKITIERFTDNAVEVKKENFTDDGQLVGDVWRRGYVNSVSGRDLLQADLPTSYVNAIFTLWGDAPTVTEVTN